MIITQTLNHTFSLIAEPGVQKAIDKLPQWVEEIQDDKVYWKAHDCQQMAAFLAALIGMDLQGLID